MANSNGWGDGAANNAIGWGQGANNAIAWGDSHAKSWAGATDIVGLTTDPAASAFIQATGITGATQQAAIDTLVKGLKADGIWSKMKAVYPFVTDNRNLLSYTEDFSNIYWNKTGGSAIVSNTTTAPNGTTTADTFITASGSMTNRMVSNTLDIIGQTVCVSIYAKSDTFNRIRLSNNASNIISADFNLDAGTLIGTTGSVISTSISSVGNGWYRCSMSYVATDATVLYRMPLITSGISSSIFVWGAQLELGSTATTYQPIATTQQAYIAAQFKYNLVNPVDSDAAFRLVFNGGWTHSSNGATPNGTNGYADTKLNSLNNLASQNSHFSFYNRSQTSGNMVEFASYDIATGQQFAGEIWRTFTGVSRAANAIQRIDAERLLPNYATTPNIQAFYLWNAPNINNRTIFRNNLKLAEQVISATAVNLPNNNVLLGTLDFGGTYILFSNRQAAFSTIGDGLTDTEAANLYTRVQAYQTALSRNV